MKTVSRTEYFEAAHLLPDYDGACRNLHGHSYKVTATVVNGAYDENKNYGMVMDYNHLKKAMRTVMPDHQFLFNCNTPIERILADTLMDCGLKCKQYKHATTAENIAVAFAQELQTYITDMLQMPDVWVTSVKLCETVNSECEVRKGEDF